jgi:hypothetical protein
MPRTAEALARGLIEAVVSARDDAAAARKERDDLAPRTVSAETLARAADLLDGPGPAAPQAEPPAAAPPADVPPVAGQ